MEEAPENGKELLYAAARANRINESTVIEGSYHTVETQPVSNHTVFTKTILSQEYTRFEKYRIFR
jgi:hypothetical protein